MNALKPVENTEHPRAAEIMAERIIACLRAVIVLFLVVSCTHFNEPGKFALPSSLSRATVLFYTENCNEQVLDEVHRALAVHPSKEVSLLSGIIASAAVCESGKPDSAALLLRRIDTVAVHTNPFLLFWYKSVKGLVLFRQDQFTASYRMLCETLTGTWYDQRAVALNKRLLGRICEMAGDYPEAIEWFLESLQLFEQCHLSKSVAVNQKFLGTHFLITGNYTEAMRYYKAAEQCFLRCNDLAELFYVYINYTDCALQQNDLANARKYAISCLGMAKKWNDPQIRTLAYEYMGEVELKGGRPRQAIILYHRALDASNTRFNMALARKVTAYLGLSQACRALKKYGKALTYAETALKLANECGEFRSTAYNNIAQIYWLLHDSGQAWHCLDSARILGNAMTKSVAKVNGDFCTAKSNLDKMTFRQEEIQASRHRQAIVYLSLTLMLLVVTAFLCVILRLQRKKHLAFKELVAKNIEMVREEDRKKEKAAVYPLLHPTSVEQGAGKEIRLEELYQRLCNWIEADKRFCRKDLTVDFVAKQMGSNRNYLSKAISSQNMRFNDVVNKYRVQEVIRILTDENNKRSRYTLSVLADEAGFNSDSVFIEAFKKQTGLTPTQFRKNLPGNSVSESIS